MANLGRVALAMLGLLAYQNRDKVGAILKGAQTGSGSSKGSLDQVLKGDFSGVHEVLNRLRNAGKNEEVDSWIATAPNKPINPEDIGAAIDPETLAALSEQTGLSRDELVRRLATNLSEAVDKLSPTGVLPDRKADEPTLLDDVPTGLNMNQGA